MKMPMKMPIRAPVKVQEIPLNVKTVHVAIIIPRDPIPLWIARILLHVAVPSTGL
jgi:hypothetical protein